MSQKRKDDKQRPDYPFTARQKRQAKGNRKGRKVERQRGGRGR
jgi:hypothetical protein